MGNASVEAFSDGVIAIVITIMSPAMGRAIRHLPRKTFTHGAQGLHLDGTSQLPMEPARLIAYFGCQVACDSMARQDPRMVEDKGPRRSAFLRRAERRFGGSRAVTG